MDYEYFKDHYLLIAKDLRKQTELKNPDLKQQIYFIGRLEEYATMFFIFHVQKIVNPLNDSNNECSKFATRKWYIINEQNNGQ